MTPHILHLDAAQGDRAMPYIRTGKARLAVRQLTKSNEERTEAYYLYVDGSTGVGNTVMRQEAPAQRAVLAGRAVVEKVR